MCKVHCFPKLILLFKKELSFDNNTHDILGSRSDFRHFQFLKEEKNIPENISHNTFRRVLSGVPSQTAVSNILSKFVGFENWEAFQQYQHRTTLQLTLDDWKTFIKNALNAELEAYRRLPILYIEDLLQYFLPDGQAFMRINNVLHTQQAKKWCLNNPHNPSCANLLNLRIISQTDEKTLLETEEYWYIKWFDPEKKEYVYTYNEKNTQEYIIEKDKDNKWKIHLNIY